MTYCPQHFPLVPFVEMDDMAVVSSQKGLHGQALFTLSSSEGSQAHTRLSGSDERYAQPRHLAEYPKILRHPRVLVLVFAHFGTSRLLSAI